MKIELKKFGTTLTSRDGGREAFTVFNPSLSKITEAEKIEIDFAGVNTFSPSWGDEFLGPIIKMFGSRLFLANTTNLSVKATLDLLETIYEYEFVRSQ